jgi:hypothetical protein
MFIHLYQILFILYGTDVTVSRLPLNIIFTVVNKNVPKFTMNQLHRAICGTFIAHRLIFNEYIITGTNVIFFISTIKPYSLYIIYKQSDKIILLNMWINFWPKNITFSRLTYIFSTK